MLSGRAYNGAYKLASSENYLENEKMYGKNELWQRREGYMPRYKSVPCRWPCIFVRTKSAAHVRASTYFAHRRRDARLLLDAYQLSHEKKLRSLMCHFNFFISKMLLHTKIIIIRSILKGKINWNNYKTTRINVWISDKIFGLIIFRVSHYGKMNSNVSK